MPPRYRENGLGNGSYLNPGMTVRCGQLKKDQREKLLTRVRELPVISGLGGSVLLCMINGIRARVSGFATMAFKEGIASQANLERVQNWSHGVEDNIGERFCDS